MKMRIAGIIALACCFLFPSIALASETPVGSIKTVKGSASVIRGRNVLESKAGTRIFTNDSLKTGPDGSMAVIFRDDTLLSIGPDTEFSIRDFQFSPAEGKLSFVTRMFKGTAACVTGIIGKLSPDSVRFETPVANIGIRGTRFAVKVEGAETGTETPR